MTFMRRRSRLASLAAAVLLTGAAGTACQDLTVDNQNSPGVDDVFGAGENLEGAISGAWNVFYGVAAGARTNSTYPVTQLAALGEDITSADAAILEVIQEPRVPYNNNDAGQWAARKPWYDLYEAIATTREALQAMNNGATVGDVTDAAPEGVDAPRARVFAKMVMGLSHLYLGLIIDQGFATDEDTDPETFEYEFSPYPAMIAHGIALLEEAIALAESSPNFTLPSTWINGQAITRDELVRVMHAYIVRGLVYGARTPAERAAVSWNAVLTRLDKTVTRPFGVQAALSISTTHSAYVQYTQLQTNGRADPRLIGPADTSGNYQRWLAAPPAEKREFVIMTPDRRVHGAGGPNTAGRYFQQLATQTMSSARGTYMHSKYRGVRYGTTYYQTGFINLITPQEMEFIEAEALFRLGRKAEVAAILNKTRTATNTNLKPVGENGPPPGDDCVPRKDDGSCGDLWDALMYEKRIELHGNEAIIPFADRRGWGLLAKGSLVHFPVTGRELQTLGLPVYTFGGDLPGSAP